MNMKRFGNGILRRRQDNEAATSAITKPFFIALEASMTTQNDVIELFLKEGGRLSPIKALNLFGVFRLASRVYDLRRKGMAIESEIVRSGKKHWVEYWVKAQGES